MFENSSSIDVFEFKRDLISVKLGPITIFLKDGSSYKNIFALCRLLSLEEIRRIDTVKNDNAIVQDSIEESIVLNCLVGFIGIDKDEVDFEASDAGLIPRLSTSIVLTSLANLNNPLLKIRTLEDEVSMIETMGAIISRYMNISYLEVVKLPINRLLRYFAVCKKTFPGEINFGAGGETESD